LLKTFQKLTPLLKKEKSSWKAVLTALYVITDYRRVSAKMSVY